MPAETLLTSALMQLMEDIKARKAREAAEAERAAAKAAAKAPPKPPDDPPAPVPPQPSVHPALPAPHYNQHDTELVTRQFSAAASTGIRALPNALHPDFRMQLYGALVLLGKERHEILRERRNHYLARGADQETMTAHDLELATATTLLLAHSAKGPPQQEPVRSSLTQYMYVVITSVKYQCMPHLQ
jgi:hypothetical protein